MLWQKKACSIVDDRPIFRTDVPSSQHKHATDLSGGNFPHLGIDPLLRDNGGLAKPHAFTYALLPGSPAIDKIPLDACHVNWIIATNVA
jgi:hypothetical protein